MEEPAVAMVWPEVKVPSPLLSRMWVVEEVAEAP